MTDTEMDAMRYRWLRDTNLMPFRNPAENGGLIGAIDAIFICDEAGPYGSMTALAPDKFDAAIDVEIAKSEKFLSEYRQETLDEIQKILDELEAEGLVVKDDCGRYIHADNLFLLAKHGVNLPISKKKPH